jgi:hypothetical protein
MVTKEQLIDAYADWLGEWPWDWFATLTHQGYPSRTTVQNKFDRWISDLQKEGGRQDFRYVMVIETGAFHDNNHVHVLVGGLKPEARRVPYRWKARWEEIAGHAMVGHFNPEQGGIRYLLKTLLPNRDFEITLKLQQQTTARTKG